MSIPCPLTFSPNCLNILSTYYYFVYALMKDLIDQFLASTKVLFSIIIYINGNFYSPSVDEYGGWIHILNLVDVKSMPCNRLRWMCLKCSMNVFTTFFHFGEINHYDKTFVKWKKGSRCGDQSFRWLVACVASTCYIISMMKINNVFTTFFHFGEINHYGTTFIEWKMVQVWQLELKVIGSFKIFQWWQLNQP